MQTNEAQGGLFRYGGPPCTSIVYRTHFLGILTIVDAEARYFAVRKSRLQHYLVDYLHVT